MEVKRCILSGVVCVMFLVIRGNAETAKTASELIKKAHKHDNMYTLGPEASQQKALRLYESALAAEPDEKQRLHILYRMAQLYGSSYDLSKGEKPDFHKAIEFNKRIVAKYPPQEPLVYKAASSICDHYTTLREFEEAIKWGKKVLEYDTTEQLQSGEIDRKTIDKIRRYQKIAVDQVAYTADHISYLRTHGVLRHLSDKYYGTFIAERADELLSENIDKMPDLWAPTNDEPFSPSGSTLQAAAPAPAVHTESQKHKGIKIQSDTIPEVTKKHGSVEPNTVEKPQKDEYVAKEPRAPPLRYFRKYIIVIAGLIVFVLAVRLTKKRITPYI